MMVACSWNPARRSFGIRRPEHPSRTWVRCPDEFFLFVVSQGHTSKGAAFITGSEGLSLRVGPYSHHSYGHVRPPPLYR
jgi:hypothetical protein